MGIARARRRLPILLTAGVMLAAMQAPALDPERPLDEANLRQWTSEAGLPQDSVQAIVQDRRGFLWLATQEGLARFDGVRFTVLSTRDTPGWSANNVVSLLEARDGSLWAGTRGGGILRVDDDGIATLGSEHGLQNLMVRALLEDREGRIWVGTRGGGVQQWDPAADRFLPPPAGIAQALVLDLCEDSDGALWAATEGRGACRLSGSEVRCFDRSEGLHDLVWAVRRTRDGALWFGTYGGGLVRRDTAGTTVVTTRDGLPSDEVTSLLEGPDGALWAGTSTGLARLYEGRVEAFTRDARLAGETVLALRHDTEGSLWVGTQNAGLVRLRDSLFTVTDGDDGLSSSVVRCVLEDRRGRLWVGTSRGGLHLLEGGRVVRRYGVEDGLPSADVFALHEAADGTLWIGTYGGGAASLRAEGLRTYSTADGLPHDTVWTIASEPDGAVWLGTYGGGLARLEAGRLRVLTTDDGLPSNLVRSLLVGRDGTLWIGTAGGGLAAYRSGSFRTLSVAGDETGTTVFDLYEDDAGVLWAGTNGRGLLVVEGDRVRRVTMAHGLHDDLMYRILPDDRGRLWFSCNRGIFRVRRDELLRAAHGLADRVYCASYGRADGMPTPECNGGSQPAGWRGRDGRLHFATPRGLVTVDPHRLVVNPRPPPVFLERVLVDGQEVPAHGTIEVPPGTRDLQIHYTALCFAAPEKVQFRHRLAGLDPRWTQAGSRRSAYFSHLPPGRYDFQVLACNNDGVWSPEGASVALRVRPRFYQGTTFLLLSALGLVLLGFTAAYGRVLTHRRRGADLARLVEARTAELLDVTRELEQANLRLRDQSLRDTLTGVANRRHFDQTLTRQWARALRTRRALGLLMVDIDFFKAYNDGCGHLGGDRCLREVAELLSTGLRRATDLLARYGGEEFAVILEEADAGTARLLAEELRRRVEAARIPHPGSIGGVVTISVGAAVIAPEPGGDALELTAAADAALYRAKQRGRNRVELFEE